MRKIHNGGVEARVVDAPRYQAGGNFLRITRVRSSLAR
jgi:hypothetical protein